MSGVEALGVLASIAQLLEFSWKLGSLIDEVYNRVKDAPEKIILHTASIKQLVEIAHFIKYHPELQNSIVHSQVKATLTEAEKLQRILERMLVDYTEGSSKKRLWKALVGRDERRMLASLDRLEKEKSALGLCITFKHAETLGNIRDSVGELIPRINSMDREFTTLSRRFSSGKNHRARGKNESLEQQRRQISVFTDTPQIDRNLVVRDAPLEIADLYNSGKNKKRQTNESAKGSVHTNPVANGFSTIVCGDYRTGATKNTYVKYSESKDNSLLVGGHWGGSGDNKSVGARSYGNSVTILSNVGNSSTAEDILETVQKGTRRI